MKRRHLLLFTLLLIDRASGSDQPSIEAFIEPDNPYVQQQMIYTLRLYRDSHLQRGYFLQPEVPNTLLVPLQPVPAARITRQGREYEVLEQSYLLFPQRSGRLQLPAPVQRFAAVMRRLNLLSFDESEGYCRDRRRCFVPLPALTHR